LYGRENGVIEHIFVILVMFAVPKYEVGNMTIKDIAPKRATSA
jgi:hypothetical protein